MRRTRWMLLTCGLVGVALGPATAGGAAVPSTRQTCPVPVVNVDPDSVTLNGPVLALPGAPGPLATASVTASETPEELGPNAPTVRLFLYRMNGANPVTDLVDGLTGPSTSGPVSLSGPATGKGLTTERISFAAPGTYTFGFLVLFDNGVHPCTSLLPLNHPFTLTVP